MVSIDNYLQHKFTISDIENYILTNAEETINLEFKRGDALKKGKSDKEKVKVKNEIAKDVSSFANSDGGIIIYGIEEKDNKACRIYYVDGREFTSETLEQIINSRIQRRIEDLRIDVLRNEAKIEQSVYIVKIPRSSNAPHRTSDGRFYKRYNLQSVIMEEYEVRDLYSRTENTNLEIIPPNIDVIRGEAVVGTGKYKGYDVYIDFEIINQGNVIEKLYKIEIHLPSEVISTSNPQVYMEKYNRRTLNHSIFSFPNKSPLYQGERLKIAKVELNIDYNNFEFIEDHKIYFKLYYSNGIKEYNFFLLDKALYKGNKLSKDHIYDSYTPPFKIGSDPKNELKI